MKSTEAFIETLMAECQKLCPPTAQTSLKTESVINVLCLRAIQFRQTQSFGLLGVIKLVKTIRKRLKITGYDMAFANGATISLVQALLRANKN